MTNINMENMKKNSYPGKFIVIEGLDGSGQSTQAFLLKDHLSAILTKEPTKDSLAGEKIKKILEKEETIGAFELQKLFADDRKEHLKNVIIPALEKGNTVISDRYFFSSFAYGISEGLNLDSLIEINKDFLLPDLTIIIKVAPELCLKRIEQRGSLVTLFEKTEKLKKVWAEYEKLANKFDNVYIIDGEKPIEEVFSKVKSLVFSQQKGGEYANIAE